MLTRSHLPPMLRYHYGPRDRSTLLRLHLSMIRSANQNDKQSRPQVYVAIWQSTYRKARNPTKPIHSVPPSNRQTIRMKEPVDRAISSTGNLKRPQGVDTLARTRNDSTQQSD